MIELKYGTRKVVSFRGAKKVIGGLSDQNKISVLLYISKEFSNVGKEDELFKTVMSLCKEIFECDNATLRLWDGEFLVPVKFIKDTAPPRRNLLPTEGYSGAAFTSKKSLLIPDLKKTPQYLDEQETTKCVICVPIMNKEEMLGTLSVESDKEFFYKQDDLEILEALGSQLALALMSVRLIEGLMTARAREKAILSQLEWDLRMGRNVQKQILQTQIEPWNGIYFASYYEPMVEVSGDYYGVVKQGNTLTAIVVDVSGHGIPAALVTMTIHYQFHQCVSQGLGLCEIMEQMADSIKPQLPESTYFTAFILRIYSDYTYAYVNGGHQKVLHFRNTGEIEELDTRGLPLGILDVRKKDYEEKQGVLGQDEFLMLFTDGFAEQKNSNGEEFGVQNLKNLFLETKETLLKEKQSIQTKELLENFVKTWKKFQGEVKNGDDLTMLILYANPAITTANSLLKAAKNAARMKNFSEAYQFALESFRIEPSYKDTLLFLAKMYYNDKNYEESEKYFAEYITTSGEDTAIIHYLHGKALFNSNRIAEAKRALKKSLSCDPTFAKSTLLLAKCYLKENTIPKAIKTLRQGVKSTPNDDKLIRSLRKLEDMSVSNN